MPDRRLSPGPAGRLRQRRAWLILLGLLFSGGLGLPLGWGLDALFTRLRLRRAWAAAAALLWTLAWSAAERGTAWISAFYHAAGALWAGTQPPGATWLLAGGWGATALWTSALLPATRRLYRRPWDADPPSPPPPLRPPVEIPDGVDLGTDTGGRPGVLTDGEANTHVLVLGATGSGKTNALLLIVASALRRGLPLIAIDGKGSAGLRQQLQALAAAAGRQLDVWSIEGPGYYNPLQHGRPSELRDKLIATEIWTEPHYRRAAEHYLGTVLDTLRVVGRPATLAAVAQLLYPAKLEALGRSLPPDQSEDLYAYLDSLDASSKSAVLGLANRLATLVKSDAGPWLDVPEGREGIDLLAAAQGGRPVLLSLDSLRYPGLVAQLGALLLQDLRAVAGALLSHPEQRLCYLVIDEFSAFSGPQVLALLNRGREAGFSCVLATQDLADVAAAGGQALVDQVLANTNVKLLLRQDVDTSANRLAAAVGTREEWQPTYRSSDDWPTGEASLRQTEAFILHPNTLKHLPPHQAVLVKKAPALTMQRLRLRRQT